MKWWPWSDRLVQVQQKALELVERTKAGLTPRANDAVIREAKAHGELVYLQVRISDGFILCNQAGRPTYYSKEMVNKYPNAAARTMRWAPVKPDNPLEHVDFVDGCFYYK